MSNKLSFGEELLLDEECPLGETDEVAVFMCLLCGGTTVAACALSGCELPVLFAAGASIYTPTGGPAAATGMVAI